MYYDTGNVIFASMMMTMIVSIPSFYALWVVRVVVAGFILAAVVVPFVEPFVLSPRSSATTVAAAAATTVAIFHPNSGFDKTKMSRATKPATAVFSSQTPNDDNINSDSDGFVDDEELFLILFEEKEKRKTGSVSGTGTPMSMSPALTEEFERDGAGVPRPSLPPEEIVPLLMKALQNVDHPTQDAGLKAMWEFATDTTRFIFKYNRTEFIESCKETADEFPTSFYGTAMKGTSWAIESDLNRVGGGGGTNSSNDDGVVWIATQVTSTVSSDGRKRRWQWELRKNRRPPCLGCWRVENIASSDRNGNFEPD